MVASHDVSSPVTTGLPLLPALVIGHVRHVRQGQGAHSFDHRVYQWLIDLDDAQSVPRWAGALRAEDHGVDDTADAHSRDGGVRTRARARAHAEGVRLKAAIVELIAGHGVDLGPRGRVVVLANIRSAGYVFNPLSVFWCLDSDGEVACIVAEVHNTYHQRSTYVLFPDDAGRVSTEKTFYVSPFNDVSGIYVMRFVLSPRRVSVSITLERDGLPPFVATITGDVLPAVPRTVVATKLAMPLMPVRVRGLITVEGVRLLMKGLPMVPRAGLAVESGGLGSDAVARRHRRDVGRGSGKGVQLMTQETVGIRPGLRGRTAQWALEHAVSRVPVVVRYPDGREIGGSSGRRHTHPHAQALPVIEIVRPTELFARLAANPKIGLGEGYMAGEWRAAQGTDLGDALTPFAATLTDLLPRSWWRLRGLVDQRIPEQQRNNRSGSRRNIEAHYDLSNDLFESFLDPSLTYSSAMFDHTRPLADQSLYEAQLRKIDSILDLAAVGAGTRVLEIGCGWGTLAIRAAQRGAHVTAITLSHEQFELAKARIAEAGLSDQVDLRIEDYRDVTGRFDAVVSVEMIEAVGAEYWDTYFATIDALLADGGTAAIQAILMPHERMMATKNSFGWIQKYIFPGGLIPSIESIDGSLASATTLRRTARIDFGPDYAQTLRRWRHAFNAAWPQLVAHVRVGGSGGPLDERFRRAWEYYLAYSEAGFASGYLQVSQLRMRRV